MSDGLSIHPGGSTVIAGAAELGAELDDGGSGAGLGGVPALTATRVLAGAAGDDVDLDVAADVADTLAASKPGGRIWSWVPAPASMGCARSARAPGAGGAGGGQTVTNTRHDHDSAGKPPRRCK